MHSPFPVIVGFCRAALRHSSALLAVVAGLSLWLLIHIHATEILPVLALTAITLRRGTPGIWRNGIIVIALLAVGAVLAVRIVGAVYVLTDPPAIESFGRALGKGINAWLRAAGHWPPLRLFFVVGIVVGLRYRSTRPLTLLGVICGLLYLWLYTSLDPLSRLWSLPFYREAMRVHSLQIYFAPALAGIGALACWRALDRRLPRAARRIVLLVTALVTLGGTLFAPLQNLKNQEKYRALIADRGLTHLYVSDHFETRYVTPPTHVDWTRTGFDSDRRLRAVLRSENATLYEIVGEESREPELCARLRAACRSAINRRLTADRLPLDAHLAGRPPFTRL